jgi:hypothetical protein
LLITLGYGVVNPLFEAPDENWHFFTAQYIATTRQLPVVAEVYDPFLSQEAAQPPLYYWLGARLIAPIDTNQAREQVWPNPFAWAGDAAALANYNQFVHSAQEEWPWQGYALAAHILRVFSTVLGLGTLICVYGCVGLFFRAHINTDEQGVNATQQRTVAQPVDWALLATSVVAFWPQFNFVHASVTNDALITFLSAAALWQLLKLWELVGTQRNSALSTQYSVLRARFLLLGVTIAAAILTKNAGTLLFLYALGFLVVLAWRRKQAKMLVAAAIYLVIPVLLLSSWLWWRNWTLYGDPTAATVFVRLAGGDRHYTLWQVLTETPSLWNSLFALFGWFNVRAPNWVFAIWNGLVVLSLLGWLIRFKQRINRGLPVTTIPSPPSPLHSPLLIILLTGWFFLVYAGLVSFMLRTPAAQGRLLFPALIPLLLALVGGWQGWEFSQKLAVTSDQSVGQLRGWRIRSGLFYLMPLLTLFTTLYCLLVVIPRAYAVPQVVESVPAAAALEPSAISLSNQLSLVGSSIETVLAQPGEPVWFTLYWQARTRPAFPPEQVVELFGLDPELPIARLHSYHGRGLYPATLWPTGVTLADRFALRLNETVDTPVLATAYVRLDGEGDGVPFGSVKIIPATWPTAPATVLAQLGEGIRLRQVQFTPAVVRAGETVTVAVIWSVAAAPQGTFTTFVHLGDPSQPPLATGDNQPRSGRYPTQVWATGEVINDQYTLTLPVDLLPGRYPLMIGMYDAAAGLRLPLTVNNERQPNDAYLVGYLTVE